MIDRQFHASGNRIELLVQIPARRTFGKLHQQHIPFADWPLERPDAAAAVARILQALEDGDTGLDGAPLVLAEPDAATLHPELVARLSDNEAQTLGLPTATLLTLELRSRGVIHRNGFRIDHAWTRHGGVPVRAAVSDGRLVVEGRAWRIPEPLY